MLDLPFPYPHKHNNLLTSDQPHILLVIHVGQFYRIFTVDLHFCNIGELGVEVIVEREIFYQDHSAGLFFYLVEQELGGEAYSQVGVALRQAHVGYSFVLLLLGIAVRHYHNWFLPVLAHKNVQVVINGQYSPFATASPASTATAGIESLNKPIKRA